MSKVAHKLNRYYRLIKTFSNWPQFLWFKMKPGKGDSFEFRLRNSFSISVPRNMLGPFRECFLDEIYLKHIDPALLKKENPVIIDIGSNVGYFSLYMFYKFPQASIYAFEPLPYCYNILKQYQEKYPQFNWKIYPLGVSEKAGSFEMYSDSPDGFSTTASMFAKSKPYKIVMHTKPLQDFITENNIQHIDFFKLDCEGAEYSILYTLPEKYWQQVSCLSMETHTLEGANENVHAMADFLKSKQFALTFIDEGNVGHIWASHQPTN